VIWVRSIVFYLAAALVVVFFGLLGVFLRPFSAFLRHYLVTRWTHFTLWWLEKCCDLRYRVTGRENIPKGPAVILANHQSAWETLAFQAIFPPHVWVLKRNLLWVPFFGWGLAALSPIAIRLNGGSRALRQVLTQGTERLRRGFWVLIFPEGRRVSLLETRDYAGGGAALAKHARCPVVLVAHNAGLFWARRSLLKHPGVIDVVIGPTLDPQDKSARQITEIAQEWIEKTSKSLLSGYPGSEQAPLLGNGRTPEKENVSQAPAD